MFLLAHPAYHTQVGKMNCDELSYRLEFNATDSQKI